MNTTILLVRHAEHAEVGHVLSGRRTDVALNDEGRRQAAHLAERMDGYGIVSLQCSPQRRTRETAQILADRLLLDVEIVDALDEIDFGAWSGLRFSELAGDPDWQRWNRARSLSAPPGGESMAAAVARIVAHLGALAQRACGPVLCVSHCDLIRGTIAHYLGLGFDNLLRFDVDPGSVSSLMLGEGGGRVTMLNAVPA